jgi:CheY-like chemotaxis protein
MATVKKILLVDDDERNTFALASYLEVQGIETVIAKDGADALEKLRQNIQPDVILLDMMMPVMDGYETLEALQANDTLKKIPVIAVTAKAMKGDAERCINAGAWDYLAKPLDLKLLMEKIAKILT